MKKSKEETLIKIITETRTDNNTVVITSALSLDSIYYLTEVVGGEFGGYKIGASFYDQAQHVKVCDMCQGVGSLFKESVP